MAFRFSTDPEVAEQQMRAIIHMMVAIGYIDADFDASERDFIREQIRQLVETRARALIGEDPALGDVISSLTRHFHEVMDEIDRRIRGLFGESVLASDGETSEQFVLSRLKLGCFELLKRFDEEEHAAIMETVDALIAADGMVHPNEQTFRDELEALLGESEELDEAELTPLEEGAVIIDKARPLQPAMKNHPFFPEHEWDFTRDREAFARESAGDMALVQAMTTHLGQQREQGQGRLAGAESLTQFRGQAPFLDGHVHVAQPGDQQDQELLVLGDLHGCYSCLKAALLQGDFFAKRQAHLDNPERHPPISLVLLGDYIDRGRFSFSGTLRTAMQLQTKMPDSVYMLRGNHEYYLDLDGRVVAPVRPCEAMDSISGVADNSVFHSYMRLFEDLPNMLIFGDIIFVHGGVPRTDTLLATWEGLESLNDPDIRFQMMWGDPSQVDQVPHELQKATARFPFGRKQFQQFMSRVGCRTMVRGHEQIDEGFRRVYEDPEAILLSLFSAGGAHNDDLPPDSSYRDVTPMALTVRLRAGVATFTPFEIDYERFNDPSYNEFFLERLG